MVGIAAGSDDKIVGDDGHVGDVEADDVGTELFVNDITSLEGDFFDIFSHFTFSF